MNVSTTLKRYREKRNLSQYDMAKLLGVSQRSVSHYELEKMLPSREVAKKIGKLTNKNIANNRLRHRDRNRVSDVTMSQRYACFFVPDDLVAKLDECRTKNRETLTSIYIRALRFYFDETRRCPLLKA